MVKTKSGSKLGGFEYPNAFMFVGDWTSIDLQLERIYTMYTTLLYTLHDPEVCQVGG